MLTLSHITHTYRRGSAEADPAYFCRNGLTTINPHDRIDHPGLECEWEKVKESGYSPVFYRIPSGPGDGNGTMEANIARRVGEK